MKLPENKTIGKIGLLTFWIPIVLCVLSFIVAGNMYNADILFSVTISSPDIETTTHELAPLWIMFFLPILYSAYAVLFTVLWHDEENSNSKLNEIYKYTGILFLTGILQNIATSGLLFIKLLS